MSEAGGESAAEGANAGEPAAELGPAERAAGPGEGAAGAGQTPRALNFSLNRLGPGSGPIGPEATWGRAAPDDVGARVDRELRRAQEEHDRKLGLGWANNALNALYTTEIRNSAPPGEGAVRIEVDFDREGRVTATRIVSGTGGEIRWRRLAKLIGETLGRKPPAGLGGGGGRVVIEVRMTERMPDGAKVAADVRLCGLFCIEGDYDPSNTGAKIMRQMHASLVSSERL